jgi:hypothetical protein
MNNNFCIVLLCLSVSVTSCISKEAFQPPPDEYTLWKKASTSVIETKKALMECGYPTPSGIDRSVTGNEIALATRCMEHAGFVEISALGTYCKLFPKLSACQVNAVIPERNVQRRLESRFSKQYPKADVCQP